MKAELRARTFGALVLAALAAGVTLACGGGDAGGGTEDTAGQQATAREQAAGEEQSGGTGQAGEGALPGWMEVNDSDGTVDMRIVAAETSANSNWNFNGYANGNATITVPRGYEITVEFSNEDPAVAHSLGIGEKPDRWPATFRDPQPVFEGAITSYPTSMSRGTTPGSSETISFTADRAGEYAMICYIPGHATAGMWIWFHVSSDGSAGFETAGSS